MQTLSKQKERDAMEGRLEKKAYTLGMVIEKVQCRLSKKPVGADPTQMLGTTALVGLSTNTRSDAVHASIDPTSYPEIEQAIFTT
jgi:hypothetical protein